MRQYPYGCDEDEEKQRFDELREAFFPSKFDED
jgi:hypothetical protein